MSTTANARVTTSYLQATIFVGQSMPWSTPLAQSSHTRSRWAVIASRWMRISATSCCTSGW